MLISLLLYLVSGAITGIIAGLLGVGGGLVIVPMLTTLFAWQHFPPDQIQHMALGTSFAAIIFTSFSSFMSHHKRGAVRWDIWKSMTPGILAGTFGGSWIAAGLSTAVLRGFLCQKTSGDAEDRLLSETTATDGHSPHTLSGFPPFPGRQEHPAACFASKSRIPAHRSPPHRKACMRVRSH